jgi:hypothetical protein
MAQVIDYEELIKAQREGINRYYYQEPVYQKKKAPQFFEDSSPSGFRPFPEGGNPGWEQIGNRNYYKDMTPEQAAARHKDRYITYTITPESQLDRYYPGWREREARLAEREQGYDFQGFEMPEMPEVTFESIYGMSEEEWLYQQEMKSDMAQFEPAWAAREAAVTSATESVDKMIRDQESYGALTGQDLVISDKARSTMIANMFADMYGGEQEQYIDEVISKYGLGDKYTKAVKRGQIGTFGQDESLALANRRGISSTVLTDNEDDILGTDVVLG